MRSMEGMVGRAEIPLIDQYQKRVLGVCFGLQRRQCKSGAFRDSFDNDDCSRVAIIIETEEKE
jgi:hypothetical protein